MSHLLLTIQKMSECNPLTMEELKLCKHLSRGDILKDPTWLFAPVLVSTNRERMEVTRLKCKLWAIKDKTHVFKWKNAVMGHVNKPDPQTLDNAAQTEAIFWQLWVPGAPARINQSVNGSLAIVNGAPVSTDSLTVQCLIGRQQIINLLQSSTSPSFGDEIEIKVPDCTQSMCIGKCGPKAEPLEVSCPSP